MGKPCDPKVSSRLESESSRGSAFYVFHSVSYNLNLLSSRKLQFGWYVTDFQTGMGEKNNPYHPEPGIR